MEEGNRPANRKVSQMLAPTQLSAFYTNEHPEAIKVAIDVLQSAIAGADYWFETYLNEEDLVNYDSGTMEEIFRRRKALKDAMMIIAELGNVTTVYEEDLSPKPPKYVAQG